MRNCSESERKPVYGLKKGVKRGCDYEVDKTKDAIIKFQREYANWLYHFDYHATEKYIDKNILTKTP